MATRKTASKTPAKAKPAPEPEELELDDEVEEIDEDEVDEAPRKTKKKAVAGQEEVTFGASDLAAVLSEGRDKPITARDVRTLARKLARDGSGRVNREIIAGNRARYNWSGPEDPEVQAIVKAFNDGELEADKKEKLDALKARKEAQKAEAEKSGKKATKGRPAKTKKTAPVVEEDDDEELDLDDED